MVTSLRQLPYIVPDVSETTRNAWMMMDFCWLFLFVNASFSRGLEKFCFARKTVAPGIVNRYCTNSTNDITEKESIHYI